MVYWRDPDRVDLAAGIEHIPPENLRVARARFGAVWCIAEQRLATASADSDWYAYGVASTCRWLAVAGEPEDGPRGPATQRSYRAMPESIELECSEADRLARLSPRPPWLAGRRDWLDGVRATLDWAWRRTGPPPFEAALSEQ
jgi:hypothetical protein